MSVCGHGFHCYPETIRRFLPDFKDPKAWGWKKRRLPILGDPDAQRKCAMAVAQAELEEAAMLPAGPDRCAAGAGCRDSLKPLHEREVKQRALNAWAPVLAFLGGARSQATMVTYAHGHEYVAASGSARCRLKPRARTRPDRAQSCLAWRCSMG